MPDKIITKYCKKHGDTDYIYENTGYYRCRKCRSEKTLRWHRNVKKKAVNKLGGKCSRCGYDKCVSALEFHHLDHPK